MPNIRGRALTPLGDLGPNERYRGDLELVEQDFGWPAADSATLLDLEAPRNNSKEWDPSPKPGISHQGVTQLSDDVVIEEVERPGSYANGVAQERHWLDKNGKLLPQFRQAALNLRHEFRPSLIMGHQYLERAGNETAKQLGSDLSTMSPKDLQEFRYSAYLHGPTGFANLLSATDPVEKERLAQKAVNPYPGPAYTAYKNKYGSDYVAQYHFFHDRFQSIWDRNHEFENKIPHGN